MTPTLSEDALKTQLAKTKQLIRELRKQIREQNESFELRWEADRRAIKRWHAANPGNDNVWPDQADLCVWLMDELAKWKAENGKLKSELLKD